MRPGRRQSRGKGTDAFHVLAASNMVRSYRAGKFKPGAGMGGNL
jgi:hypothetical protein